MPLVSVGTSSARVICVWCGHERDVKFKDFARVEEDVSCFKPPACPACAAEGIDSGETFFWHDEVYTRHREEWVEVEPIERTSEEQTDEELRRFALQVTIEAAPDDYRAEQMVLIEQVAVRVPGVKQTVKNKPVRGHLFGYEKDPKAPDPNKVRNLVGIRMMRDGKKVLPGFL